MGMGPFTKLSLAVSVVLLSFFLADGNAVYVKNFVAQPLTEPVSRLQTGPDTEQLTLDVPFTAMAKKYKTVIVIHGLKDTEYSLQSMVDFIKEKHEGTNVVYIDVLHGIWSFGPMWSQVEIFYSKMAPYMYANSDGVILIGYSQGGLIARAILESKPHNVHTFISLSSPQAGYYGDRYLNYVGTKKVDAHNLFYTSFGQSISVGGYWNDPHFQRDFLSQSLFLPFIDNLRPHPRIDQFKDGFSRLMRLVLIGGPDDGIISPWQSSQFSFYDERENVVDFRLREIFTKDLFGLRTLYDANLVTIYEVPNVTHYEWHLREDIIEKYILPWLD